MRNLTHDRCPQCHVPRGVVHKMSCTQPYHDRGADVLSEVARKPIRKREDDDLEEIEESVFGPSEDDVRSRK